MNGQKKSKTKGCVNNRHATRRRDMSPYLDTPHGSIPKSVLRVTVLAGLGRAVAFGRGLQHSSFTALLVVFSHDKCICVSIYTYARLTKI